MPKTGNILLDLLSIVSIFSPLWPAAIIFLKKQYQQETLNFLMILCLLNFLRSYQLAFLPLAEAAEQMMLNAFSLIELSLMLLLFKSSLPLKTDRTAHIVLIVFFSVIITAYLFNGLKEKNVLLTWGGELAILFLSLFYIAKLISEGSIYIFNKPIFWIAVGSLFYFFTAMIVQIIGWYYQELPQSNNIEKKALLDIAGLARYFFYALAALYFKHPKKRKAHTDFF